MGEKSIDRQIGEKERWGCIVWVGTSKGRGGKGKDREGGAGAPRGGRHTSLS